VEPVLHRRRPHCGAQSFPGTGPPLCGVCRCAVTHIVLISVQALWTQDLWNSWGIQSDITSYEIYLNYPEDHSLSLLSKSGDGRDAQAWKVEFEASLEEDVLDVDPTTGRKDRVPTFHGYSASGNVTAPFVYVNHGTYQDFEDLVKANVSLEGKIAIVKYGYIFRGLKVKRAQELGMVGCLIYSDPGDDGEFTEENGYKTYPEGVARNPTSVQRGSTQFLSSRPGDPYVPALCPLLYLMLVLTTSPRLIGLPLGTLPSRVSLGHLPTTVYHRFHQFRYPMQMPFPF
jgi:hypothetical protein